MVNKKEGNITWSSNNNYNLPQIVNNHSRQAGTPLPPREGINTPPARPLPPSQEEEGPNLLQTSSAPSSQAIAQLPSQEESNSQAIVLLPSQEGSNSPLASGPPRQFCPREVSNPTTALPPTREGGIPPPKQVNLIIKIGPAVKALGTLIGTGLPKLPRRTTMSPRKITPPLPPTRPPRDLPLRILTLSGSLTSPANL